MKSSKFLDAEKIALEEVDNEWVSVTMAGEKFVMDMDTLYDLSFRFASFLAYLEKREEEASGNQVTEEALACTCAVKLH